MKTLAMTGVWLAAAVSSLAAQQSYVWVANGAGNSVTIKTPGGTTVATLGAGYGFNAPYDIVAVPRYNKMIVSNNGGGNLTVINSRTFAFEASVPLTGATNLRGLSVSGDEEYVFVAAEHTLNPAVFRLQMADLSETLAGEIVDSANFAEDCVVVNASQVGGSGNGPGKVYFSVPATPGYIGVITINPPSITSIPMALAPLANVDRPSQLERTPDHAVVFAGCRTNDGGNLLRVVRVAVGPTDNVTQPIVKTATQNLGNSVIDVAFRPGPPPYRGYINSFIDASPEVINEIDVAGNSLAVALPARATAVPASGRIRFDANPEKLYVGETSGTANQYGMADAGTQPVGPVALISSGAAGPRAFAFSPQAFTIQSICPRGQVTTPVSVVHIFGSGFDPAASATFVGGFGPVAVPTTYVDSGHLLADVSGLLNDLWSVTVTNPGPKVLSLASHYLAIDGGAVVQTPFTVTLPSRFQGYRMLSFPQFATAADLQGAVQNQLGGYNPSFVRIFFQNGNGYQELNGINPANLCDLSGRSFWALTRFGANLTLSAPAVSVNTQLNGFDERVIPVFPGWNMISQPQVNGLNARMNLSDVLVYSDGNLATFEGGLDTVATATATSFPFEYVNGAYVALTATDRLQAGNGYWLRNNTGAPLYLSFQASDAVLKTKPMAAMSVAPVAGLTAADLTPPAPPESVTEEESDTSGCGALGLEAFLALAFLRAVRRRRLAG